MDFPFGETVTIVRGGGIDNMGDPIPGEPERPVDGCAVWPGPTSEDVAAGRAPVRADFTVTMPTGTDVTRTDRLRIRGELCNVAGVPFDWRNPFTGWSPGMQVYASLRKG